jgi:hypothetical protein
MIKLQDEMYNLAKFTHFQKFIFIKKWLKKTCDLLGQVYVFLITSCKRFHSKKISYQKVKNVKKRLM